MIGTIRKHQTWLWYGVIGATIFSFVAYFNPASRYKQGSSDNGSGFNGGSIFGDPITRDQLAVARREAAIFYRLNANEWPSSEAANQRVDNIARQFLLIDAELRHNHIEVTPEAAARFTKQIVGLKPNEALTKDMLDNILTKLLASGNGEVTGDDFVRFVNLSAGQQYLTAIFGMTGQLITPKEAEAFYRRENEPMVTEMVSFPASNYMAMVMPSTADIADFYNKRQAQYRVPEQVALNYVEFPTANYMDAGDKALVKEVGTNLDQKIDEIYASQDPANYKDETGTNQLSPDAAKAKIKSQFRTRAALLEARKDAVAFANKLLDGHDEQHPFTPGDMTTVASSGGLTVQSTAPFDEKNAPTNIDLGPKELRLVFAMNNDDPEDKDKSRIYISSPIVTEKGVYIVGLKNRLPSHITPLEEIREQVARDYRRSKAMELARDAAQKFEDAVKAVNSPNQTFDQLCRDHGAKPITLPPFSMVTPSIPEIKDRADFQQLQSVAFNIPTGRISPFVPTAEGGFALYVKQRLPVDESKMEEQLPVFLTRMREQRQVAAFQQWLNREYQLHANFPAEKPAAANS